MTPDATPRPDVAARTDDPLLLYRASEYAALVALSWGQPTARASARADVAALEALAAALSVYQRLANAPRPTPPTVDTQLEGETAAARLTVLHMLGIR